MAKTKELRWHSKPWGRFTTAFDDKTKGAVVKECEAQFKMQIKFDNKSGYLLHSRQITKYELAHIKGFMSGLGTANYGIDY